MYLNSVSMKCELLSRFDTQAKKLPRTGCTRGLEEGTPLNSTVGDANSCTEEKTSLKTCFPLYAQMHGGISTNLIVWFRGSDVFILY